LGAINIFKIKFWKKLITSIKIFFMKRNFICCLLFIIVALQHSKAQNVGIGTASPQAKLEVKEAVKSRIKISSNSYSDTSQLILSNRISNAFGTDIILSSNQEQGLRILSKSDLAQNTYDSIMQLTPQGLVGINTTNPQERLDVRGNMNITGGIKVNGVAGTNRQVLTADAGGNLQWAQQSFANTERFRLTGYGSVASPGFIVFPNFDRIAYNYSSNIIINLSNQTIIFNKAGLYHLEFSGTGYTNTITNDGLLGYLLINGFQEYVNYEPPTKLLGTASSAVLKFITDRYMPSGTVLKIGILSSMELRDSFLSGYLIAE
jgi:hypothetical protein